MDESKTAFPRLVTGRSQEKACMAESMNSRKKLVAAGPPLGSISAVVIYISILQAESPVAEKDWKKLQSYLSEQEAKLLLFRKQECTGIGWEICHLAIVQRKRILDIEDEANSRHEITGMNSSILFKWTRLKGGLTRPFKYWKGCHTKDLGTKV